MKIRSFRPKKHNLETSLKLTTVGESQVRDGAVKKVLRLIPLGGVGDVTKNMYVYEYGDDIIVVDCGVGFPEEGMLGIDLIIPDMNYLRDKVDKIRGILITHAHDDHIGGLPYLWPELNVPIYTQRLTAGLIKAKFKEHNIPTDKVNAVSLDEELKLGVFEVSFYQVSHSIPDSTGIVIRTPVGVVVHQADFKMDWTPVNGQVTDVGKLARVAVEGIILMTIDCLRVEKQGLNVSERAIEGTFEKVEKETKGKLLITMTSSNLTRVQQAINVAVKSGRKLVLAGRSMDNNFQVARDLGYLDVPPELVIAQDEIRRFPDERLMVLIAGSQGQPGSALSRAANNDHKFIFLKKDDGVIFSADPIPSTESAQSSLIDTLTRLGCDVYYSAMMSDVHISGHATGDEIKVMLNLAKPKYILPIGGTFRHMKYFSRMTKDMGYREDQILMARDGQIIEVDRDKALINGIIEVSNIYVDGLGVGDVGSIVLRDRKVLAEEGVVVVVVPVDPRANKVLGDLDIISRGFVFEKEAEDLIETAKEIVKSCLTDHPEGTVMDWRFMRNHIEENLQKFFYEETNRRPMILTIVVDL